MSSFKTTGNRLHDLTCNQALSVLQGSLATATTQAQVTAAYVVYYRALIASSRANNLGPDLSQEISALRELGFNS